MSLLIVLVPTSRFPKRSFAFDPRTDPYDVLLQMCWAYADGVQSICTLPGCPASEGGYCLECHMEADTARHYARSRFASPAKDRAMMMGDA